MYRPILLTSPQPPRLNPQPWQETWGRLLVPLTLWLCGAVILRYGCYGDSRMALGPCSSRLMKASSVFVQQIEVRDEDKKGVLVYGFAEKPQLSLETNWSLSDYMTLASYSRKGFSLWLNKGSMVRMRWEAPTSTINQLQVAMVKGERRFETLLPRLSSSPDNISINEPIIGKEAEYMIEEDDKYHLGLINTNPKSIIMKLKVNVTSKMYDLSNARNICSTIDGSCRLKLPFPKSQYVAVTTPDNGDISGWSIGLSFVARVITYIVILGFIMIIVFVILKYLGAFNGGENEGGVRQVSETEPILSHKPIRRTYGTNGEDDDDRSSSSSSEDLDDEKLCVICCDDQRNCFFIPCGHSATCYACAQRIMEVDNKMCPICRRLIKRVRRMFMLKKVVKINKANNYSNGDTSY